MASGKVHLGEAAIWNGRYANPRQHPESAREPWTAAWRDAVAAVSPGKALDIGCGLGFDTEELLARGFEVTAVDLSDSAIDLARRRNPTAQHYVADVRRLPAEISAPFGLVIANLSLHYFGKAETEAIFSSIADLLSPGGLFLFRVNAEDELGAPPDPGSWELVVLGGLPKQFFDENKIRGLLSECLDVLSLKKLSTNRFGSRKSLYEVVARKAQRTGGLAGSRPPPS